MNIDNLTLYQQVNKYKDSNITSLYFRNRKIDFKTLIKRIDKQAERLYFIGVRKNDVVTILSPNVIDNVVTIYALNKIGAIVSILHPLASANELITSIKETNSKFLFILDARYSNYYKYLKGVDINIYFLSARYDLNLFEKFGFKFLFLFKNRLVKHKRLLNKIKCNDVSFDINNDNIKPSFYLQSGGTTGKSKTIILNDKAISYPGSQSFNILGREIKGISMIGLLPFYHGFGLSMGLHAPLMNEAASSLMIKYNPKEICKKIKKNQLNVLIVIPYLAKKLLKEKAFNGPKLKNLYATYMGADKGDIKVINEFDQLMIKNNSNNRLLQGYGLSECVAVNFVNTFNEDKVGSVGKPLNDVKCKITKLDSFDEIKVNDVGRILLSSPSMCLGYLNTSNKDLFKEIDGIKYLVTGDIGYLDKDNYLFIEGRQFDVVKIAGYNVFPNVIENEVKKVNNVKEACIIHVVKDKHPYLALFIVCNKKDNNIKKEVLSHLKKSILKYSIPEEIILIDKLPLTKLGKIDKTKLLNSI